VIQAQVFLVVLSGFERAQRVGPGVVEDADLHCGGGGSGGSTWTLVEGCRWSGGWWLRWWDFWVRTGLSAKLS
jgi:hypothetical protein